jgi:predicted histone-like DNA-binding protein
MSKILYEVYKNDIKDSESAMFGKYYARLKSIETMNISKMAKHIADHGSVFTEDVVEGVMKKFKSCLIEMLLESKKVKVNGLGTFYLTCECQKGGADKEEDFNVKENLKALHIRFLPDQAAEDNLSSREFIKKAEFFNIKNLMKTDGSAVSGSDGDDSGDADGKTDGEGTSEGSNGSSGSSGSSENQNPSGGGENQGGDNTGGTPGGGGFDSGD